MRLEFGVADKSLMADPDRHIWIGTCAVYHGAFGGAVGALRDGRPLVKTATYPSIESAFATYRQGNSGVA